MPQNLERVLDGKAIVFASRNVLMGLHQGLERPVSIGPDREGVITALAYNQGKLYYIERKPHGELHILDNIRDTETFLYESTSSKLIGTGMDGIVVNNGRLIAVESPDDDFNAAVIVDPFTGAQLSGRMENIRWTGPDSDLGNHLSFLRIDCVSDNVYVLGAKKSYRWKPGGVGRQLKELDDRTGPSSPFMTHQIATDECGRDAYRVDHNVSGPTEDHVAIQKFPHGRVVAHWPLNNTKENIGFVYMGTLVGSYLVLGIVNDGRNHLYAVKTGSQDRSIGERDASMPAKPLLLMENAFQTGEAIPRNNPMITLSSKADLDGLLQRI